MALETLGGKELSVEEKKVMFFLLLFCFILFCFPFIPSVKSSRKDDLKEYRLGCILHYLNWLFRILGLDSSLILMKPFSTSARIPLRNVIQKFLSIFFTENVKIFYV